MVGYLGRRMSALVVLLFGISILVFLILKLVPGSEVSAILGSSPTTPAIVARLTRQLGLNQPLPVQYWKWLSGVMTGNLGYSYAEQEPVAALIAQNLPSTLQLAALSLAFATVGGAVIGTWAALRRGSLVDLVSTSMAMLLVALPSFFLGLVLILLFGVYLGWFPVVGGAGFSGLVLPAATLGLGILGITARFVRSSLVDAGTQPHVVAARARGLSPGQVFRRHVARNALPPIVTVLGLQVGAVLSGTVVVEVVFSRPGIGRLLVSAILAKDYPTVQAIVLFIAGAYVIANLIVDILYPVMDPRVRGA